MPHTAQTLELPARLELGRSPLWTWLFVPLAFMLTGLICLPIDIPVAAYFRHGSYPSFLREVLENAETFGHAAGVLLISVTIANLDPRGWRVGVLAFGTAACGGLSANIGKLLVQRTRPRNYELLTGDVWNTFGTWFPLGSGGTPQQSMPSAHTATAFAFFVVLATLYPRGKFWFLALASLVALHRLQTSAHFPSDVMFGAALGWVVGHAVVLAASPAVAQSTAEAAKTRQAA